MQGKTELPPTDMESGADGNLESWRARALNATLAVISVAGAPAIGFIIGQAVRERERWMAASIFSAIYLFTIALTISRRLPLRLRAWGVLLLGYVAGALSLARGGLAGDGTMYFLALPPLATILLGTRSGVAAVGFSLLGFASFAFAAQRGWLTRWLITLDKPLPPIEWAYKGTAFAMLLVGLSALQWFSTRFLLQAWRRARERVSELEITCTRLQQRLEELDRSRDEARQD